MKKLFTKFCYIVTVTILFIGLSLKSRAQVVEYFEGATANATSFTNAATGIAFSLTNNFMINNISTAGVDAHTPASVSGSSDFFIDNFNNIGTAQTNAIKTSGTLFNVKSLYIYPSSQNDGHVPTNDGTITFIGKKAGVQQFTFSKSGIFETNVISGSGNFNHSGFTLIDFSSGTDHSNTPIDELDIVEDNTYDYVAVDNFQFAPITTINSITKTGSTPTNASSVQYTVTFGASVTGLTTSNFSLTTSGVSGASVSSVSGSGTTYTVSVNTGSGDGSVQLNLANTTGLSDNVSNSLPFAGDTYTIDKTPPTVLTIAAQDPSPTNETALDYTVTFSEPVTGVDASDFIATATGVSNTGISVTPISSTVYNITVNNVSGNGTLRVDLNSSGTGITDAVGNAISGGFTGGDTFTLDQTSPTVASVAAPVDGTYGQGGVLVFTVNFSEPVFVNTGGGTPYINVQLNSGTIHAAYASGTGTSALNFTYTVVTNDNDPDGIAIGSLAANGGTLQDAVGNDATLTLNSVGSTTNVLIDAVPPAVTSIAAVGSSPTNATSVDYTVTFSEAVSGVFASDFTATATGTAAGTVSNVSGSGSVYTVTVGSISGDGTLRLDLNSGTGIFDLNSNQISGGFTGGDVYTIDNTAPTAFTLTYSSNHPGNQLIAVAGDIISLNFTASEAIQAPTVSIGGHSVTASNTSGNDWVASYTMIAADPDGRIAFNLQFNDLAGNTSFAYTDIVAGDDIEFLNTAAGLTNLTINHNAAFTAAYSPAQFTYTSNVPYSTNEISLTPACDTTATVTVNGIGVSSGTKSQKFALSVGDNTLTVVVTAHDGVTKSTYTVTVHRAASPNAYLSNIKINGGLITLSPSFNYLTNTYTATTTISSIKILPAAADPGATIKVNTAAVASGTASNALALNVGSNTITTVVTAADGTSTNTYTITLTRALPANADLKNLKINNGSVALSPVFNFATTSYTASVPGATSSVRIIPATHDASATVTVNALAVTSGTASAPIALSVGDNTITTVVTASDGTTIKTYTITVNRAVGPIADPYYQAISVQGPVNAPPVDGDGVLVHQGVSPNGDGVNDGLVIEGIRAFPENRLVIMNRNGAVVYEAKGYDNTSKVFDGHSNKTGALQLPGTYFYSLDYTVKGVSKRKTGFIVLKW